MPSHLDVFQKTQWKRAYCDTLGLPHYRAWGLCVVHEGCGKTPIPSDILFSAPESRIKVLPVAHLFLHFDSRRSQGSSVQE